MLHIISVKWVMISISCWLQTFDFSHCFWFVIMHETAVLIHLWLIECLLLSILMAYLKDKEDNVD